MIGGDKPTAIANLMRRFLMKSIAAQLDRYIHSHPLNLGDDEFETVLDQLYQAYAESHETDPPGVAEGFKELENFLCTLPLKENNAVFNLCCRLCSEYERKAFLDGLQYGAHLMRELDAEG